MYKCLFTISAAVPWTVEDLLDEDSQSDRVPLQKLQQLGTVYISLLKQSYGRLDLQ